MSAKIVACWVLLLTVLLAARVEAQVTAPTTLATGIQVQGELPGTEFDDWAGVPVAYLDPADNPGEFDGRSFVDIAGVSIANDADFLYIRMDYHTTSSAGTYVGVDIDQDASTGFNLFDLNVIGSEFGYENDYFFQQTEVEYYLDGIGGGGPAGDGTALIYPFFDQDGTSKELAIPMDLMLRSDPLTPGSAFVPAFGAAIDLMIFTEEGAGDVTEVISYTFATTTVSLPADFNGDGTVDLLDLDILGANFGSTGATFAQGDANADTNVDLLDLDILGTNFGAISSVSIPEPAAALLSLVACISATAFGRSHRIA